MHFKFAAVVDTTVTFPFSFKVGLKREKCSLSGLVGFYQQLVQLLVVCTQSLDEGFYPDM